MMMDSCPSFRWDSGRVLKPKTFLINKFRNEPVDTLDDKINSIEEDGCCPENNPLTVTERPLEAARANQVPVVRQAGPAYPPNRPGDPAAAASSGGEASDDEGGPVPLRKRLKDPPIQKVVLKVKPSYSGGGLLHQAKPYDYSGTDSSRRQFGGGPQFDGGEKQWAAAANQPGAASSIDLRIKQLEESLGLPFRSLYDDKAGDKYNTPRYDRNLQQQQQQQKFEVPPPPPPLLPAARKIHDTAQMGFFGSLRGPSSPETEDGNVKTRLKFHLSRRNSGGEPPGYPGVPPPPPPPVAPRYTLPPAVHFSPYPTPAKSSAYLNRVKQILEEERLGGYSHIRPVLNTWAAAAADNRFRLQNFCNNNNNNGGVGRMPDFVRPPPPQEWPGKGYPPCKPEPGITHSCFVDNRGGGAGGGGVYPPFGGGSWRPYSVIVPRPTEQETPVRQASPADDLDNKFLVEKLPAYCLPDVRPRQADEVGIEREIKEEPVEHEPDKDCRLTSAAELEDRRAELASSPPLPVQEQLADLSDEDEDEADDDEDWRPPPAIHPGTGSPAPIKRKRGRPATRPPRLPLPPLYVFIRNLLLNSSYNPSVVEWVDRAGGVFKVANTKEFARTWGRMKSNRSEEMTYEKMSRAMRYHYGSKKAGRKGHLAVVDRRLIYKFGELAVNWDKCGDGECASHQLCRSSFCLWSRE